MQKTLLQLTLEALQEDGVDVCPMPYSGRRMMGAECLAARVGLGTSMLGLGASIINAARTILARDEPVDALVEHEEALSDLEALLDCTCTDQLGLGMVVYWQDVQYVNG
jgi:hypothetical protein